MARAGRDVEERADITLPPDLALALGVRMLRVYYPPLVGGAVSHGAWSGSTEIVLTPEQSKAIEGLIAAHCRAAAEYHDARHDSFKGARQAARPNRPGQRWAGMAGRARRNA